MTISEVSQKYGLSQDTLRYYEKAGMIPPVHRTLGGLRDYTDEDCGWVELAKCMRSAGVQVEAIAEYVRLAQQGDKTLADRCQLLKEQRVQLAGQLQSIEAAMERLDYKISRYEEAVKTGVLHWD
ncbi:MAG: MerR family transcriptional regulator [Marvinbryantia sp.]|uniref:MerR family transcriptional regulator n=1 Tax=Marvinbryantia sp. TaxID=2496532 RepID=UPI0025EC65FF|nr:MerR family transcriptional regulator [uncultured Marvinbryantia sp.]